MLQKMLQKSAHGWGLVVDGFPARLSCHSPAPGNGEDPPLDEPQTLMMYSVSFSCRGGDIL
jgi:hypothetical protein